MESKMIRSIVMALSFALVATPALAQQPLQPAAVPTVPQPQYDPRLPEQQAARPIDPYAQYGEPDEEDDGMDVTYDISTSPQADQQEAQYDDGYDPNAYQQ